MYRIITISIFFMFFAFVSSWGTIINIPGDYPTIQQGIDASVDGDTVLVQPGTYVENINFNGHNIVLGSLFLTTGDTSYISQTVIDGSRSAAVVRFENGEDSTAAIHGFTIQNGEGTGSGGGIFCTGSHPTIYKNAITGNIAPKGGGIFCDSSNAIISNNLIMENISDAYAGSAGGGIYCSSSNLTIINNVIRENSAVGVFGGGGGGIDFFRSNAAIINNVISDNRSTVGGGIGCSVLSNLIICNNIISKNLALNRGGGIDCGAGSALTISNTILWADSSQDFNEISVDTSSTITISYSNVQDTLWPGIGNISVDPLFRDTANGDFHLCEDSCGYLVDSPCIDTGDPDILDRLLDCAWGLGSARSDMGAYGGGDSGMVNIIDNDCFLPKEITLLQNYPNPFNSGTAIRFIIVKSTEVRLAVYDMLGRKVQTLIDEYKQAGFHTANFDATGLSSGVYFCRLQAGEAVMTRPMVLLR
ncbi:MAG: T9SS type A sorting domain-containing protein [Candidatus Zixiibacteriota bacterium]|nr:MAG: T9SS type A sorting domain-containing protein [candidate division Zixibacteria bacterium]